MRCVTESCVFLTQFVLLKLIAQGFDEHVRQTLQKVSVPCCA
jgi:hypothetical protein